MHYICLCVTDASVQYLVAPTKKLFPVYLGTVFCYMNERG